MIPNERKRPVVEVDMFFYAFQGLLCPVIIFEDALEHSVSVGV